jgi:hypothetical protein
MKEWKQEGGASQSKFAFEKRISLHIRNGGDFKAETG